MFDWVDSLFEFFGITLDLEHLTCVEFFQYSIKVGVAIACFKVFMHFLTDIAGLGGRLR